MATRSAVLIETTSGRAALYRHWDGYPAVGGATLAQACRASKCGEDILLALLQELDDQRHVYELVDAPGRAGEEHVYLVQYRCSGHDLPRHRCGTGPEVLTIQHAERPSHGSFSDDWINWPRRSYSLPEFVEAVNADRRAMNAHLAARRKAGEGWALKAEDFDML